MSTHNPDVTTTSNDTEASESSEPSRRVSRRTVLASVGATGAAASLGFLAGKAEGSTAAAPSGTVGSATEPYLRIYADRVVFVERTSDPSSPADGTVWYNSDG